MMTDIYGMAEYDRNAAIDAALYYLPAKKQTVAHIVVAITGQHFDTSDRNQAYVANAVRQYLRPRCQRVPADNCGEQYPVRGHWERPALSSFRRCQSVWTRENIALAFANSDCLNDGECEALMRADTATTLRMHVCCNISTACQSSVSTTRQTARLNS